jgi:MOSC domain-containing protein YiiM
VLELTEPRKPCYVLDKVHPALQEAVIGRCGFLARVIQSGRVFPGQRMAVCSQSTSLEQCKECCQSREKKVSG